MVHVGKITIDGVLAGVFTDGENRTGTTTLIFPQGATGAALILGGGPATRGFDSLKPEAPPTRIYAFTVAGGSAMGLDSAAGVTRFLRENRIGLPIDHERVPTHATCVIFDLFVGRAVPPDTKEVYRACREAGREIPHGPYGAGTGATVGKLYTVKRASPGGQSYLEANCGEFNVGCLCVVNAFGDVVDGDRILAGATDPEGRFFIDSHQSIKRGAVREVPSITGENTTICCIITDAKLTKPQAHRVATVAASGMARAIRPVWTVYDGDIVAVLSVGDKKGDITRLGVVAADLIEHGIRRAVQRSSRAERAAP